eukprot:TRINITY_DN111021_c0_g1_i1.p1 TRINITY_DN111021_c0_g1~~TRINITY_DN111021_c0_g1_i1.p1  ORF type:complete len:1307 (+),score=348.00 TRINITY_DN111021_c0_g1_i1:151-4071(+)
MMSVRRPTTWLLVFQVAFGLSAEEELRIQGRRAVLEEKRARYRVDDASFPGWTTMAGVAKNLGFGTSGDGSCQAGAKIDLDVKQVDLHTKNPNCEAGDCARGPDGKYYVVLPEGMSDGESRDLFCTDVVATSKDDLSTGGNNILYGSMTLRCSEGGLKIEHHFCREYIPFSVMHAAGVGHSNAQPPAQPEQQRWEYARYQCAPPPAAVLLSADVGGAAGDLGAALRYAQRLCDRSEECRGVAIEKETRKMSFMKNFTCPGGEFSKLPQFESGQKVRFRGVPYPMPQLAPDDEGVVVEQIDTEGRVLVDFGSRGTRYLFEADLALLDDKSPFIILQKIRPAQVFCDELIPEHSCDVPDLSNSLILFEDDKKDAAACQQECQKAAAAMDELSLGCCVHSGSTCALTYPSGRSQAAADKADSSAGGFATLFALKPRIGSEDASAQKRHAKNPEAPEAAGTCSMRFCAFDVSCMPSSRSFHTSVPDNVPGDEGDDAVALYWDFSETLSREYYHEVSNFANIWHYDSTTIPDEAKKRGSVRIIGYAKKSEFSPEGAVKRREHDLPFRADVYGKDRENIEELQEELDMRCSEHSFTWNTPLLAPLLSAEDAHACIGETGGPEDELFQSCLIQKGCYRRDPDMKPYQRPYFSNLPIDILATQQPAPFCCGLPSSQEQAQDMLQKLFFQKAGIMHVSETLKVMQKGDLDVEKKSNMAQGLRAGSKSIKTMLQQNSDPETLDFMVKFVGKARESLSSYLVEYKGSMEEEADASGSSVEFSEDGNSVLEYDEDGPVIAPYSGRRAREVARYSHEHGGFLEIGEFQEGVEDADATDGGSDSLVELDEIPNDEDQDHKYKQREQVQAMTGQAASKKEGIREIKDAAIVYKDEKNPLLNGWFQKAEKNEQVKGLDENLMFGSKPVYVRLQESGFMTGNTGLAASEKIPEMVIYYVPAARKWVLNEVLDGNAWLSESLVTKAPSPELAFWPETSEVERLSLVDLKKGNVRRYCKLGEEDLDCPGNDAGFHGFVATHKECQEVCDKQAQGCKYFVFVKKTEDEGVTNCYPKYKCSPATLRKGVQVYGDCDEVGATIMDVGKRMLKKAVKRVKDAAEYGLAPLWKYIISPIMKAGMSFVTYMLEHPKTVWFIMKIALLFRDMICRQISISMLGMNTEEVSFVGGAMEAVGFAYDQVSPAAMMMAMNKFVDQYSDSISQLGKAGLGAMLMPLAIVPMPLGTLAHGVLSSLTNTVVDATLDAAKSALEDSMVEELLGEATSNLVDMVMTKCIYQRTVKKVTSFWGSGQKSKEAKASSSSSSSSS